MTEISVIAPFDFHLHSSLSHDGQASIADYCELAVSRHMRAIGFCEHLDLDRRDVNFGMHDYASYCAEVEDARSRHGDRLTIRRGVEVGYVPRIDGEIREFLAGHDYDYTVGSIHAIDDGMSGISDEYDALETFARHEVMEVYRDYFELTLEMVVSGLFDVVGHLDLVRRFGVNHLAGEMDWGRFYGILRGIFEGAIKRQMAIEINTSGLRQDPKSAYPPRELLALYREIGGRAVILGSDAHRPEDLGNGIPAAVKIVRELQLKPVAFKERLPESLEL